MMYHYKLDSFPKLKDFSNEIACINECGILIVYNELCQPLEDQHSPGDKYVLTMQNVTKA